MNANENKKELLGSIAVLVFFFLLYSFLAYLARGGDDWWFVDTVSGGNVLWGDDAYRFFLAKYAPHSPGIYFFNFTLPLALSLDQFLLIISDDQFYVRILKSGVLSAAAFFLYSACRVYTSRWVSFFSVCSVFTLPLLAFVGVSFFAESWFVAFFSIFIYCVVKERYGFAILVVGLLPLIRIEGLAVLVPFSLYLFLNKNYWSALSGYIPGFIYFLLVITIGPGFEEFLSWRDSMAEVYESAGVWYQFHSHVLLGSLNLLLVFVGFVGYMVQRKYIYLLASFFIIVSFFVILSVVGRSNFEPRYLVAAMPALPLGVVFFINWFYGLKESFVWLPWFRFVPVVIFVSFGVYNVGSIHVVDQVASYAIKNKKFPQKVIESPFSLNTYFKKMTKSEIDEYSDLANAVHLVIDEKKNIKNLVVSHFLLYYFLDPDILRGRVNPVFALFGRGRLDPIMGQSLTAGYFPKEPYFSYFSLRYPYHGDDLILYADLIPFDGYPLRWKIGGNYLAVFAGEEVSPKNIEDIKFKSIEIP